MVALGMDTSGSFKGRNSRWPADVKGKPARGTVLHTLDIDCLTGLWERA